MDFKDFNFHDDLQAGVSAMGYKIPTPVQQQAIPAILEGKDLIAVAQTGTGKTAAYLLPLLNKISHAQHDHTSTLILVPTRELAKQIDEQVDGFSYFVSATSIPIYGGNKGESWDQQKKAITSGADIIIATPGRFIAHMNMGYVNMERLEYLVLDEADKMMDMGFMDDLLRIIRHLPANRQTLMFSATMPPKIRDFAKKILKDPAEISLAISKPAANINQQFYMAHDKSKLKLLEHLVKELDVQSMIIFTSRKSGVNEIERALTKMGLPAKGINSDRTQEEREEVLREFKNKQFRFLVATDILSRGIDVDNLSHVLNYDVPQDAEDYVHRIGRTARAAASGMAITFINDKDQDRVVRIENLIERELEKITVEGFDAPDFDPKKHRKSAHKTGRGRSGGGRREGGRPNDRRRSDKPTENRANEIAETEGKPAAVSSETGNPESKKRKKPFNRNRKPRPEADPNRPITMAKPRPEKSSTAE